MILCELTILIGILGPYLTGEMSSQAFLVLDAILLCQITMVSNRATALAAIGGLLAISSVMLPWYNNGFFSYNLLYALKPSSCPPGAYCELVPASTSLIVALVFTVIGGFLGIASSLIVRKISPKISRGLVILGLVMIVVGVVVSLSDAIVREGLSIGFYTDTFSAVLFIAHIIIHK